MTASTTTRLLTALLAGALLPVVALTPPSAAQVAAPASPTLTAAVSSLTRVDRPTPVVGHLLADDLSPLAGEPVELLEETGGTRQLVATGSTDAVGAVVFDRVPRDGVRYVLRHPATAAAPALEATTSTPQPQPLSVPTAVALKAVAADRALRVSFRPPVDDGGSDVLRYDVVVNGRVLQLPPSQFEVLVDGLVNGTSYPVSARAVTAVGAGTSASTTAVPRADAPAPSTGTLLCGQVTGRTTTLTAAGSPYRLCGAGLSVRPGALLTLDAAGGALVVKADGADGLRVEGGDLRTTGTAAGRGVTLDPGNAGSWEGVATGLGPFLPGEDPSTVLLEHTAVLFARVPVRAGLPSAAVRLRDVRLRAQSHSPTVLSLLGTPTLLERVTASGPSSGHGVSLSCSTCPVTVTDLTVEGAGRAGLHVRDVQRLRLTRVHVSRSGYGDAEPWPAVWLDRVRTRFGTDPTVTGLTGQGNGVDAAVLSGTVEGALTWTAPTNSTQRHPLGLLLGQVALPTGASLTVPRDTALQSVARCERDSGQVVCGGGLVLDGGTLSAEPGSVLTSAGDTTVGAVPCPSAVAFRCTVDRSAWQGVQARGASTATLTGARLRGADRGLQGLPGTRLTVVDSTVEDSTSGVAGGDVTVTGSTVRRVGRLDGASSAGDAAVRGVPLQVDGSTFEDVSGDAVRVQAGTTVTRSSFTRIGRSALSGTDVVEPRLADLRLHETGTADGSPAARLRGSLRLGAGGIERLTGRGGRDDALHLAGTLAADAEWVTPYNSADEHPLGYRLARDLTVPEGVVLTVPRGGLVTSVGTPTTGTAPAVLTLAGGVLDATAGAAVLAAVGDPRVFRTCPSAFSPTCSAAPVPFGDVLVTGSPGGRPGELRLTDASVWSAPVELSQGAATVSRSRLVSTPVRAVRQSSLDLSDSRLTGAGITTFDAGSVVVRRVVVDGAPRRGVDVGSSTPSTAGVTLQDVTVTRSGAATPAGAAPDAAVRLHNVRATFGTGGSVSGLQGHSNGLDAVQLDRVRADSDLVFQTVRNQGVLHPLGHLPAHGDDLTGPDTSLVMATGTTLRLPRGSVLKSGGSIRLDSASLDASAGSAVLTSAGDDTVGPRTCRPDALTGACPAGRPTVVAGRVDGGPAPTVRVVGATSRLALGVADAAGSTPEDAAHGAVLRSSRLAGFTGIRSATSLTDVASSSSLLLSGAPAGSGRSEVRNSTAVQQAGIGPGLGVRATPVDLERLTLRGGPGTLGGFSSPGLEVVNTSASARCLDLRDSPSAGLYAHRESPDATPYSVSLRDSTLTGNSTERPARPTDADVFVPVTTTGVWWGQPGGPRDGQVDDRALLSDVQPAAAAPACAGGAPALPPEPPTDATAQLAGGVVTVSWRAPADASVTAYTITSATGQETVVGAGSRSATVPAVPGLSSYDVRARNAVGDSPPATTNMVGTPLAPQDEPAPALPGDPLPGPAPTSPAPDPTASPNPSTSSPAPVPASSPGAGRGVELGYTALAPARVLDTRDGTGRLGRLPTDRPVTLQVTGRGGVPTTGVSAVVLNTTVTGPSASGHLTVFPGDQGAPLASNLNYRRGQTVPNLVVVPVDPQGAVRLLANAGNPHVIADVVGWYGPQASLRYAALPPVRVLDTRVGTGLQGRLPVHRAVSLRVTGRGGVPAAGVSAVVLNTTVTGPSASGYLTVFPGDRTAPLASNLNFVRGQTVPNLVIVPVAPDGTVRLLANAGAPHVIADVVGWFGPQAALRYAALTPARILDTRDGTGHDGRLPADRPVTLRVTGRGGVPATGVSAVVLNTTVTGPSASGYLTVFPGDRAAPLASNLNFRRGQTVPNLVVVPVAPDGTVRLLANAGTPHAIADVVGWYGR